LYKASNEACPQWIETAHVRIIAGGLYVPDHPPSVGKSLGDCTYQERQSLFLEAIRHTAKVKRRNMEYVKQLHLTLYNTTVKNMDPIDEENDVCIQKKIIELEETFQRFCTYGLTEEGTQKCGIIHSQKYTLPMTICGLNVTSYSSNSHIDQRCNGKFTFGMRTDLIEIPPFQWYPTRRRLLSLLVAATILHTIR
jgi:hypothetical protein